MPKSKKARPPLTAAGLLARRPYETMNAMEKALLRRLKRREGTELVRRVVEHLNRHVMLK